MNSNSTIKKANSLQRQGELTLALELYYKIIKKNPNFYWAYIKVGEILILQNKLDEAIQSLLKAIEINPGSTTASSILEQARVKKMSNINVSGEFHTDYYCATLEEGNVVFRSKQSLKTICRLASYICEYATIYRVYYG
ncbi:tetratricopeptide repeat protein, partial [Arthrospira platensis SPKY2]